tara:strand:- start:326 stop:592 length:267 start_codon:yes stop_codon:yes gene_type:complete
MSLSDEKIIQLCEDVSAVKVMATEQRCDIIKVEKRLNGSFDVMDEHIKESQYWRDRVAQHDIKMKVYTFIFGTLHVAIIAALVQIFLK